MNEVVRPTIRSQLNKRRGKERYQVTYGETLDNSTSLTLRGERSNEQRIRATTEVTGCETWAKIALSPSSRPVKYAGRVTVIPFWWARSVSFPHLPRKWSSA